MILKEKSTFKADTEHESFLVIDASGRVRASCESEQDAKRFQLFLENIGEWYHG